MCSPALDEALKAYLEAYQQDLNQPYAGLAALGLLCLHNALAQALPGPWADQFDSDEEAARELAASVARAAQLASARAVLAQVARATRSGASPSSTTRSSRVSSSSKRTSPS